MRYEIGRKVIFPKQNAFFMSETKSASSCLISYRCTLKHHASLYWDLRR